jgi:hypothetical protein
MDLDDIVEEGMPETVVSQADTSNGTKSSQKKGKIVPVDDEHPFDLDAYISTYTGAFELNHL